MKLAFFEVEEWQKKYLQERLKGNEIKFFEGDLSEKNVSQIKDVEGIGVFIYSQVTKEILDKLLNLKFIVTMSTGFDHIDINECKKRNIIIANVPSYGENTVAEHAIGLMLCLAKKLPLAIEQAKKGNFNIDNLEGFDLKGKTLGVIGCGNIGRHVVKIARAMEMEVIINSMTQDKNFEKEFKVKYVNLDYLLKNSDIVTLHVPLTKETEHLINMSNIKKIKKGSYLINTARGGIVETEALIYGLDNGILAGAALDVLEEEEELKDERYLSKRKLSFSERRILKQNHKLLKKRNVIITPHTGFFTHEALQRILDITIENVKSSGRKNKVNQSIGP